MLCYICDKHAPRRKKLVRGIRCPWLTREIKDLMNKRDFHLRKARRTNAEVDGVLIGRHVTTFLIRLKVRNGVFIARNLTTTVTLVIQLPFGRQ